jgi:hypothetical protein
MSIKDYNRSALSKKTFIAWHKQGQNPIYAKCFICKPNRRKFTIIFA